MEVYGLMYMRNVVVNTMWYFLILSDSQTEISIVLTEYLAMLYNLIYNLVTYKKYTS